MGEGRSGQHDARRTHLGACMGAVLSRQWKTDRQFLHGTALHSQAWQSQATKVTCSVLHSDFPAGTFGEAFKAGGVVLKIVPMEGTVLVNSEPQKRADEILAEVSVTLTLSRLNGAAVAPGKGALGRGGVGGSLRCPALPLNSLPANVAWNGRVLCQASHSSSSAAPLCLPACPTPSRRRGPSRQRHQRLCGDLWGGRLPGGLQRCPVPRVAPLG
jgi:hypothetical protein